MRKLIILNVVFLWVVAIAGCITVVGCTNKESQALNETLKNQRISLTHDIDSFNRMKLRYVAEIDSLRKVQEYIIANQETRERNDQLISERKSIEIDIKGKINIRNEMVRQNEALKKQIEKNKFAIAASKYVYIITVRVHQTTYTLSISEHIKNKMNDIVFDIPVDKDYYDKCSAGQKITDPGLKWGSLLRDGDFSKLKITITGKKTLKR